MLRTRLGDRRSARTRTIIKIMAPLVAFGLVATACSSDDDGGDSGSPTSDSPTTDAPDTGDTGDTGEFPRNETLFTSGTQWGPPSNWNPLQGGGQATGVRGLLYETLFLFDPWTTELQPWLAESGEWTADDTYELKLREGLTWNDGEPLTAEDVVFTVELGHEPAVRFSNVWDWLDSAEAVDDTTVVFTFSDPRHGEWDNFIYANQIVPKHVWENVPPEEIGTFANDPSADGNGVGSGPYRYHSHTDQRMVWERNDDWWAIEALDLTVKPRYVVDLINSSNEVALGLIASGRLDLSNNFLPGITQLVNGDFNVTTFYPEAPYMLAANTAMLIPNTTKAPTNDAEFRRALAYTMDIETIVNTAYGGIVTAANPTGLLPVWDHLVDQGVVDELGFSYDIDEAKQILADAGYEDTDGDGFVENPDGSAIELSLITPAGWTDWNLSAEVLANGAKEAGINLTAQTPSSQEVDDARNSGDFDLLINNWTDLNNTPWTFYNYLFRLPIQDNQTSANFSRFESEEAWELVQEVGSISASDEAIAEPLAELQRITLTEFPAIPMWYNGLWSQVNNDVWTNFPSGDGAPYPSTWTNFWEKGSIYTLTQIELAD